MVTKADELAKIKNIIEVELPPFSDGTIVTAEIRKVHFNALAKAGKIPNPLLNTVMDMLGEGNKVKDDNAKSKENQDMVGFYKYMNIVAEAALVNPTYSEFEELAGGLSDEQLFFIHNLAVGEAKEWQKFC